MTTIEKVKRYIFLMEQSEGELWARKSHKQKVIGKMGPRICAGPSYRELKDLLKDILKEYDEVDMSVAQKNPYQCHCGTLLLDNGKCYFAGQLWHEEKRYPKVIPVKYDKQQHIDDLQTRNTELVEENRRLKEGLYTAIKTIKTEVDVLTLMVK